MSLKFAAFIMTYERPSEVLVMINKLVGQTIPPQKILVVDNSDSLQTESVVRTLNHANVDYYRVGYNSGPAGAAYFGLKRLTEEGYEWIYWGDDDDPPTTPYDFERIFEVIERASGVYKKIGVVGKGAGKFNPLTARTSSFMNKELTADIMEADFVPGNNVSLINSAIVTSGVLPSKELFFGFEELDFCLKVKRAGYKILFDAEAFLKKRIAEGKVDPHYRWRGQSNGEAGKLWRQYYSSRNMLKVLAKNGLWLALFVNIVRTILKSFYGFRFGWKFGLSNFRVQILALGHFLIGKSGKFKLDTIVRV